MVKSAVSKTLGDSTGAPTAQLAHFKPITAGIKAIDRSEILKINWCTGQVKRIGNGQAPIPQESGLWVMAKLAWQMAFPGKKRLPTKLRAG